MLPLDEVTWFRDCHEEWIKAYEDPARNERGELPEDKLDEWPIRHLRHTLQVSSAQEVVFLLDTKSKDPATGEMKAWLFANYLPGAKVYDSFSDLFVECQREITAQGEVEAAKF
jgi:hypothetical protein